MRQDMGWKRRRDKSGDVGGRTALGGAAAHGPRVRAIYVYGTAGIIDSHWAISNQVVAQDVLKLLLGGAL
jgi:hypothetical protein